MALLHRSRLRDVVRRDLWRRPASTLRTPAQPGVSITRHPGLVAAAVLASPHDFHPFWLAYVTCGGRADERAFSDYLHGRGELEETEKLALEHAAWELHTFGF